MAFDVRSWLPLSGLMLLGAGCSLLDGRSDPAETAVPPLLVAPSQGNAPAAAPASPPAPILRRTPQVHPAAFEQPVRVDTDEPRDVLPLPNPGRLSDSARPANPVSVQLVPRTIDEALSPPTSPDVSVDHQPTMELDLTSALSLAAGQNPRIAFAAARYREAYARFESAQVLWLPSLRAGVTFNHHDGTLQASDGFVIDASRSSFQAGLGTRAIGAGSPATPGLIAEFHTTDAVFQPKITGLNASARDAAAEATTNDTLLATALAYLDLLRTAQQLRIAEETRANAQKLADLTATFARSGQGSQADADRTQTELVRRHNEVSRAEEAHRVANARLAEFLSLDPSTQIAPHEVTIVPIELVQHQQRAADLVATGLSNRPELAEAQYLVCEAVNRYRREKFAPLLPSVLLGISQSGFGGGLGSNIDNYRGRFDVDATVFWELRNFGLGDRARRDETWSQYDQARALQVSMLDRVAREVVEAHLQVQSRHGQIRIAQSGVEAATNSYARDLARTREGQGLPIEVLQSMQALDDARREYLRTLADYNEAQFRLQRALGWPIQ